MFKVKKSKLIIFCTLITICAFQLVGCGSRNLIHADYPFYEDEQSLFNRADIIITGEVVKVNKADKININGDKVKKGTDEEDKIKYTVSEVKVIEVIKGDVKTGDIVKVKQLGDKEGIADAELIKYDGYLTKNMQYVLFLKGYSDINSEIPYSTLNPIQGQLDIVNDKVKVNELNKLFKSDILLGEFVSELKNKIKNDK